VPSGTGENGASAGISSLEKADVAEPSERLLPWYVEPLAHDRPSLEAAVLRLAGGLQAQANRLEAASSALRGDAPKR